MSDQESPGSSVAGTPHRKPMKKRKLPEAAKELATNELTKGYCILLELLKGHKPFLYPPDSNAKNMIDYYEVVKEPMWMDEMRRRFESGEYKELTQFAADVRLLLENCYRFFGPNNITSRRALKLEQTYVECVSLLPREMQSQCSLLPGVEINEIDGENEEYKSELLEQIIAEQRKEDEEHKRKVAEQVCLAEKDKDILRWEREVLVTEDMERQIKGMWELPLIGQFVYLALDALNIDEMSMYEVERMLLMPRASQALARLVTSLLISPMLRQRLSRLPPMSYHMWSRRLAHRVSSWYRTYHKNDYNPLKMFELMGVETEFWKVVGENNPFEEREFHELSFHQRVWVLKSLCDYCLHNQSTVQDIVGTPEVRDSYKHKLGRDSEDYHYEHLPELCGDDLRVYRQAGNYMSLIERDEVYWEGVAAKTSGLQDNTTKDYSASDTCTDDGKPRRGRKKRAKSIESDSGLSSNSCDTRQFDDWCSDQALDSSRTMLVRSDYFKCNSELYNPHWLDPENSGFEVVAHSYDSLTDLIVRLGGETSEIRVFNIKTPKKKMPKCEADLVRELQVLAANLKRFEVEFIACMKKARERMYKEWQEYQKRSSDFVDPSDAIWSLSADQHEMVDDKGDCNDKGACNDKGDRNDKGDCKIENSLEESVTAIKENHCEEIPEHKSEDGEGRERYSRRAKRKVDIGHIQRALSDDALLIQDTLSDDLQIEYLGSDTEDYEEEIEEDDDDEWRMPSDKKKKKGSGQKTSGKKRKAGAQDSVIPDGSEITPEMKTPKSSGKKIANTSNRKAVPFQKKASRKLFGNDNSSVPNISNTADQVPTATPEVSVKKEADAPSFAAGCQGSIGNVQVKQETETKQEIKIEPQAAIKQETDPIAGSSVPPATDAGFQSNSMPVFVYQPQQMSAYAGASSVIMTFSTNAVPLAPTSQVPESVPVAQSQAAVPVSPAHSQAPVVGPPIRETVLQRAGPTPVISSEVICLDSDNDSDVELVEDIKTEPKAPLPPITPGKISLVSEHLLMNEVTPPKNLNYLNTLKNAMDKRLNMNKSGEKPHEFGQRMPFTVQPQYQTSPSTSPAQTRPGMGNIQVRNVTPNHSLLMSSLQQNSPFAPKRPAVGRGTDHMSSMFSTPKKQPTTYPTTPRNVMPSALSNSPRGASPTTFSPNRMQWNSPRGQYSPRPATRGRGSYTPRQTTPVRGQGTTARGRASPLQPMTASSGLRANMFQQDNVNSSLAGLPIVGDVDPSTGSFRYALVMLNGSRIPLTPEQVDQIRKENNGMLPSRFR